MRSNHSRNICVKRRRQEGHWKGDLIIGALTQSAIAPLVERSTRFGVLVALPDGLRAPQVAQVLAQALGSLAAPLSRSLTWDQGFEMYQHSHVSEATGTTSLTSHRPWQPGTNNNSAKLLRQYPK